MPRSFTFSTITEYRAAKASSGTVGAIYAELVSSGIKSGSVVSKITATGDVFIDSINPFVTPDLGQEGDTLYYSSTEGYRFLRAGNSVWNDQSLGQVYIDLAKIPSGFSVVAPYTDIFNYKQTDENIGSGKASMSKILGNTVAWNQAYINTTFVTSTESGITYTKVDAYTWTISGTASGVNTKSFVDENLLISGHKYYVSTGVPIRKMNLKYYGVVYPAFSIIITTASGNVQFTHDADASYSTAITVKPILVDLTLLYGSAIDGLTDAQILAKFESEFPGYHSYNAGTLLSNKAKAIEFVGFNQWDEEWEVGGITWDTGELVVKTDRIRSKNFVQAVSGVTYYVKCSQDLFICFYDADGNFVGNGYGKNSEVQIPANATYLKFYVVPAYGTTYNHDICINLSGNRNGQYEPYKKVVLPLPNLDNIKVYSHNLYDPATGKAKVEGGKQYYIGGTYTSISQNGTAITVSSHLFTPSESGDVDVVGGNSTDTIINLSSSFNGQYEPHGILTINGLKSAGSVYDEIVGNKLVKRMGRQDLGALNWFFYAQASYAHTFRSSGISSKVKHSVVYEVPNAVCQKYAIQETVGGEGNMMSLRVDTDGSINICDYNYSTTSDFKTGASGVYLDYELATPIEYEIYSPTKMPYNWKYRVSPYHTKKMLPENGEEPTTAPFACEIKQI